MKTPEGIDDVGRCAAAAELMPALRRLDALLRRVLQATQAAGGVRAAGLQGLYLSPEDALGLLADGPGAPFESADTAALSESSRLTQLQQRFGLTPFEIDIVLIALAPELDLRYERIYGFLQDDLSRRWASVDLALNLRCASAEQKIARLADFGIGAPLIRQGILHLVADPSQTQPPLLAHYLKVDAQLLDALLDRRGIDRRLAGFCRYCEPGPTLASLYLPDERKCALLTLARRAMAMQQPLHLQFHGPNGSGRLTTARALARELGLNVLRVELSKLDDTGPTDFTEAMRTVCREAWLKRSMIYVDHYEALRPEDMARLHEVLAPAGGIVVLATVTPLALDADAVPPDLIGVAFGPLDHPQREQCWRANLDRLALRAEASDIEALAGRFRLTAGQIARAAAHGACLALWRTAGAARTDAGTLAPTRSELFAAARAQSGSALAGVTRKIEPRQAWGDVVLPPDQLQQMREICTQALLRQQVYGAWGFDRKLSLGKGLIALFAGPPGTGKTMSAQVIATELQLDLYQIDLSQVVSKYIGETEKQLDRIFNAAEGANAILFFDEADALFGKRSEVKDAHDRYANIEIGYLLQKMEEYEGVAILATNLRQNLDDAFLRRMQFIVDFPFPDEELRRAIWRVTFPREAPLADDVDFSILAREVKLAGGSIKNIALAASFHAAADGTTIGMAQLARAARREHQKLGRAWPPQAGELGANKFPNRVSGA
jgi:SpoVK/Ycf46/Vps4 family AAA+-type ATPase